MLDNAAAEGHVIHALDHIDAVLIHPLFDVQDLERVLLQLLRQVVHFVKHRLLIELFAFL